MRHLSRLLGGLLLTFVLLGHSVAQQVSQSATTVYNSTITVTNTFQTLLADNSDRKGCLLQNQGSHVMYVGVNGSPTTSNSFIVQAGQTFSCLAPGIRVTQLLQITGTSGDAFVLWSQ